MDAGGGEGREAAGKIREEHASLLDKTALASVLSMEELVEEAAGEAIMPPAAPSGPDELLGLMYTSGSTGRPKGAMYPEALVRALWRTGFSWSKGEVPTVALGCVAVLLGHGRWWPGRLSIDPPTSHQADTPMNEKSDGRTDSMLPLNHIVGRVTVYQTLSKGGVVFFVRSPDMSTLFDDVRPCVLSHPIHARPPPPQSPISPTHKQSNEQMAACRPTSMMMVPRILNMAYETYKLKRASLLAAAGLSSSGSEEENDEVARVDRQAKDHVRDAVFGGRLLFQLVGSAPSSPEVMECIRGCNGVPFVDGYGSTGASACRGRIEERRGGVWGVTTRQELFLSHDTIPILQCSAHTTRHDTRCRVRRHHHRQPHQRAHGARVEAR